jgi:hypothetical protein
LPRNREPPNQIGKVGMSAITFGKSKLKYLFVKTCLHVVSSVQDSAQFNISQGAFCAVSVVRKSFEMGFLPLNIQPILQPN